MKIAKIVFVILLLLTSCNSNKNEERNRELKRIIQVADTNAYEAGFIFDSLINIDNNKSRENLMLKELLKIKIADKTDKLNYLNSLETIDSIVDFFKGIDNQEELAEAIYYKGRIYSELGNAKDAAVQFNLAKNLLVDSKRYYLRIAVSSQLAFVYNIFKMVENTNEEELYSWRLALKTGNVGYIARMENSILSHYIQYDSLAKAEFHLNNLLNNYQLSDSSELKARILIQMAYLRTKQHRYREADSILTKVACFPDSVDGDALNYISALLYSNWGKTEKAKSFYRKMMTEGRSTDSRLAFNKLLRIAEENKDWELINEVAEASQRVDSVEKKALSYEKNSYIDNMEYAMRKNDSQKRIIERLERRINIIIGVAVAAFVIIMLLMAIAVYRKNKAKGDDGCVAKGEEEIPAVLDMNTQPEIMEASGDKFNVKVKNKEIMPVSPEKFLDIQFLKEITKQKDHVLNDSEWIIIENEIKELDRVFYDKFLNYDLNESEWRMSLLLKANIKPIVISRLMGRTPSAIAKMRKVACSKILDIEDCTPGKWDEFVSRS